MTIDNVCSLEGATAFEDRGELEDSIAVEDSARIEELIGIGNTTCVEN